MENVLFLFVVFIYCKRLAHLWYWNMKKNLLNQKNESIFLIIEKKKIQKASLWIDPDPLYLNGHLNVTLNSLKMFSSIS